MAAMMPSGTGANQSANPYDRYDAPVDDGLIDPDDGMAHSPLILYDYTLITRNSNPRRPRRPRGSIRPRPPYRPHQQ